VEQTASPKNAFELDRAFFEAAAWTPPATFAHTIQKSERTSFRRKGERQFWSSGEELLEGVRPNLLVSLQLQSRSHLKRTQAPHKFKKLATWRAGP